MVKEILDWLDASDKVGYVLVGLVVGYLMSVLFRNIEEYLNDEETGEP